MATPATPPQEWWQMALQSQIFGIFIGAALGWMGSYLTNLQSAKRSSELKDKEFAHAEGMKGLEFSHEKDTMEANYLREQLHRVYGPLQYYASLNQICFDTNSAYFDAGAKEYEGRLGPNASSQQYDAHGEEMMKSINIGNELIEYVVRNNEQIVEVLREQYAYIDTDDMEMLNRFSSDMMRRQVEFDKKGLRLPLVIYRHLEEVSFMRHEFIQRVNEKFLAKHEQLRRLGG